MDAFRVAYDRVAKLEAGYANDPTDKGGETLFGISRVHNPLWSGWRLVDIWRRCPDFVERIESSKELKLQAYEFFHFIYWVPVVPTSHYEQRVAEELLDQSVHMGPKRAVLHLQRALNVLNIGGARWPDVQADGVIGPRTESAYESCLVAGYATELLHALDILQGAYLFGRMEEDPTQERFAVGWLRRVFEPRSGE